MFVTDLLICLHDCLWVMLHGEGLKDSLCCFDFGEILCLERIPMLN